MAVAWQHTGYNQPPWPDYFLGYKMGQAPRDNIVYVGSGSGSSSSSVLSSSSVMQSSSSAVTPIVLPKFMNSNALNAMQNAVNLYVANETILKVFNLNGNAVRAMRFVPGNYVVPLNDLPKGMYIVKASNASWQKTIKVNVLGM
jgi:hypothetical protein